MSTPVLISIVGRKGSGKSAVLEALISLLARRGFRVGVIKHMARDDFEVDDPSKDTYQYRTNGAETVVLAGRKRLALFSNLEAEVPLENLLEFFLKFDLVFLEGYFSEEVPKIEVHKKVLGDLILTERVENIFAICSDSPPTRDLPHFSFGQIERLASLIEEELLKKGTEVST